MVDFFEVIFPLSCLYERLGLGMTTSLLCISNRKFGNSSHRVSYQDLHFTKSKAMLKFMVLAYSLSTIMGD